MRRKTRAMSAAATRGKTRSRNQRGYSGYRATGPLGKVYLIHAHGHVGNEKHRASHYLGWAKDLPARIREHEKGTGAKLVAAFNDAGVSWEVVWWIDQTDRGFERLLKRRHNHADLCPICRKKRQEERARLKGDSAK